MLKGQGKENGSHPATQQTLNLTPSTKCAIIILLVRETERVSEDAKETQTADSTPPTSPTLNLTLSTKCAIINTQEGRKTQINQKEGIDYEEDHHADHR